MFEYPKRTIQHKNESKSLAIFLYHLKDTGIFRDIRESDYGIDLEYEYVDKENVIGRITKIQLKSVSRINKRNPKLRGIKQSTLNYWAELSYRINTIVVGVNNSNEEIYFTYPIFWDAISQIDNTKKSKSITFLKSKGDCTTAKAYISGMPLIPTVGEIIYVHKHILERMPDIIDFCSTSIYSDQFLEFENFTQLKLLLDDAKTLLWNVEGIIKKQFEQYKRSQKWNSLDFFRKNTKDGVLKIWDMKDKLNVIIVLLFEELISLRRRVLNSTYYWIINDVDYLELVYTFNFEKIVSDNIEGIIKNFSTNENSLLEKDFNDYLIRNIDKYEKQKA